jgi:hypothetical protein
VLVTDSLGLVVHIQIEILDHLKHQVGRREVDDLVVDIDLGDSESEVRE